MGFQAPGLGIPGHKQVERLRGILRIVPTHAHGDGEPAFYEARYVEPNPPGGRHLIAKMGFENGPEIPRFRHRGCAEGPGQHGQAEGAAAGEHLASR
jgi:hypothetical protein